MIVWLPVLGYADRYEASSEGQIRLVSSRRLIKSRPDKDGYRIVDLWDFDRYYTVKVHQLVLTAFSGEPPEDDYEVDHINRIKDDNRPKNLRWVTHGDNERNKPVRSDSGIKGVCYRAHKQSWQAYYYTPERRFVHLGMFKTQAAAAEAVAAAHADIRGAR